MNKLLVQEELVYLTSYFSKLLKKRFGKGPEKCFVTHDRSWFAVHVHNFATPAEQALVEGGHNLLAYRFRSTVMDKVCSEFALEAEKVLGAVLNVHYSDWDYDSNAGILLMGNDQAGHSDAGNRSDADSRLGEQLAERIKQLCSDTCKTPERLDLIPLHPNLYAVQCHGVLLPIERLLFEKGSVSILQERSAEIKQRFAARKESFSAVFGRAVEGLFMIWDYRKDRSYILFCLKNG
ncbi:Na-translocating system protein MpsC family protein [Cohnella caldifontis]|uniref:Na-translocating system protein MpsC family protein n=1 Tax=Cohnella caldifontis TaxID=3027471 RepID=UPI0023EC4E86|nr:Na-translocating system protein MpsC family protein [Cohnella sp. YIM B05605]